MALKGDLQSKTVWVLFTWALIATVGFGWVLGKRSISGPPRPAESRPATKPIAAATASALSTTAPVSRGAPTYPQFVSSIPKPFRGRWDELVSDKCKDREARFTLGGRTLENFEVRWDVTKVKLYSPTEMDLFVTTKDDNASQVDDVFQFKLADGGQSLTGRKPGTDFFQRCPKG